MYSTSASLEFGKIIIHEYSEDFMGDSKPRFEVAIESVSISNPNISNRKFKATFGILVYATSENFKYISSSPMFKKTDNLDADFYCLIKPPLDDSIDYSDSVLNQAQRCQQWCNKVNVYIDKYMENYEAQDDIVKRATEFLRNGDSKELSTSFIFYYVLHETQKLLCISIGNSPSHHKSFTGELDEFFEQEDIKESTKHVNHVAITIFDKDIAKLYDMEYLSKRLNEAYGDNIRFTME